MHVNWLQETVNEKESMLHKIIKLTIIQRTERGEGIDKLTFSCGSGISLFR